MALARALANAAELCLVEYSRKTSVCNIFILRGQIRRAQPQLYLRVHELERRFRLFQYSLCRQGLRPCLPRQDVLHSIFVRGPNPREVRVCVIDVDWVSRVFIHEPGNFTELWSGSVYLQLLY